MSLKRMDGPCPQMLAGVMEGWQSGLMRLSREQEARKRPGVRIPRLPYGKVSERSNVRAWRARGATNPHRFESCPFRKYRALAERSMATGLNPVGVKAPVRSNRTRSGCPVNVTGRSPETPSPMWLQTHW